MPYPQQMSGHRTLALALCLLGAAAPLASASFSAAVPRGVLAEVRYVGGLCAPGTLCTARVVVHQDGRVRGAGRPPARLSPAQLGALRRAIAVIDVAEVRAHPFQGTCPTAYDGSEAVYRFRGHVPVLRSCRYDLRRVSAVRLLERLVAR